MDWSANPTHHLNGGRRPEAKRLVRAHIELRDLRAMGIVRAEFVSTFHSTDGGITEHITVKLWKLRGGFYSTHHVDSERTTAQIQASMQANHNRNRARQARRRRRNRHGQAV